MTNKKNKTISIPLGKVFLLGIVMIMLSVTIYFANVLLNRSQSLSVGAAAGVADLFLEPESITMPPDGLVNLWVTTDKQLGFVAVDLAFDPTLIKLSQEITLPTATLQKTIKVSTMAQANTTGKISIVLGIEPTGISTAPTGTFPLANLKFSKNTAISNKLATLTIVQTSSQLVDLGAIPFSLTSKNASFNLNPVASPVATLAPSTTPTSVPTPTPVATVTPTVKPTPTPVPTATPVSGNTDFIGPSLSLTTGKSWYKTYVTAKATDISGIQQIVMTKDGVVVKSCSNVSSCTYYPSSKFARPYNVVVTATDKSIIKNISSSTITVK